MAINRIKDKLKTSHSIWLYHYDTPHSSGKRCNVIESTEGFTIWCDNKINFYHTLEELVNKHFKGIVLFENEMDKFPL